MIKTTWTNDLPLKYCEHLNTRVIGEDGVSPSKTFEGGGGCYACPTNRKCNVIPAENYKQHVLDTHPAFESKYRPPEHTLVIEADIFSSISERRNMKIGNVLYHRVITTYSDNNVRYNTTQ